LVSASTLASLATLSVLDVSLITLDVTIDLGAGCITHASLATPPVLDVSIVTLAGTLDHGAGCIAATHVLSVHLPFGLAAAASLTAHGCRVVGAGGRGTRVSEALNLFFFWTFLLLGLKILTGHHQHQQAGQTACQQHPVHHRRDLVWFLTT